MPPEGGGYLQRTCSLPTFYLCLRGWSQSQSPPVDCRLLAAGPSAGTWLDVAGLPRDRGTVREGWQISEDTVIHRGLGCSSLSRCGPQGSLGDRTGWSALHSFVCGCPVLAGYTGTAPLWAPCLLTAEVLQHPRVCRLVSGVGGPAVTLRAPLTQLSGLAPTPSSEQLTSELEGV